MVGTRKWLDTQEAQALLGKVSRLAWKEIRTRRLSPGFIVGDLWTTRSTDDMLEDLHSELCLFILEKRPRLQRVLISGETNTASYLKTAFINHWISAIRGPDKDRRRYLHKRIVNVLGDSGTFHTFIGTSKRMAFSLAAESFPIPPLCSEDFTDISFPYAKLGRLGYDQINKKSVLLELADYFWSQISRLWDNKPVRVDIGDFVAWLSLHVSTDSVMPAKERFAENGRAQNPVDEVPDDRHRPDRNLFDPELLRSWAQSLVNSLTGKERATLYLRYKQGVSLEKTAQSLGLKGASGVLYHQEKAEEKMRFFLRDLPGLSPDDLEKTAFSIFYDTLFLLLKDAAPES